MTLPWRVVDELACTADAASSQAAARFRLPCLPQQRGFQPKSCTSAPVDPVLQLLQVFQVRKKDTGHIYAMKVMRKEKILEKDHGQYVKQERDVLTAVFHPYIVTLRYSFQVRLWFGARVRRTQGRWDSLCAVLQGRESLSGSSTGLAVTSGHSMLSTA